jgi:Ca2+-transporting ATPase
LNEPVSKTTISPRAAADAADTPWHAQPPDAVLAALGTARQGLSASEARARLERYGPNLLARGKGDPIWTLLQRQIDNPLIWVLLASAALAILLGKPLDGAVVLGVVVLNTIIGFVQEYRAGQAIQALSAMVPDYAIVLRDGGTHTIPAAELVPGDVVLLASGDKVPADLRLFENKSLRIDEAALTGESVPTEKDIAAVAPDASLGDRLGMAYGGTLVAYGTATGVVVATALQTELGRISSMLDNADELQTPLTRSMASVGRILTVAILIVAAVMAAIGLFRGYQFIDAALAAITLAVAAIPEGLPAIITIALAIGVRRMARRRAVIRKLPAVETLGSTTVICSDKTGTLTRNEMTVQALWTCHGNVEVSGIGHVPEGTLSPTPTGAASDAIHELLLAGTLCNDATLRKDGEHWTITGDPTEAALVVAAHKLGISETDARSGIPRIDAIPFESELQYMATLHRDTRGSVIYLKGAPEVVISRCGVNPDGSAVAKVLVLEQVDAMASRGMRVLAVAGRRPEAPMTAIHEPNTTAGFTLLGLVGMIDPPRGEAIEAVKTCHAAGIVVKMITGDHAGTAQAIGRQLGLLDASGRAVIGSELAAMNDEQLRTAATTANVFARVAPEHKLRLVKALQAEGHVVAMTGDGVNDAPALKQANIGVAMGITGTAVSKEAADIVLTDDNFASIAAAVEEGRRVYDNLIKSLAFVLPTNLGLALILITAVIFFPRIDGVPMLPMEPVQILWINLVATVALALPLAFEAMEPNLMRRPPRPPGAPVLSRFVITRTFVAGALMAAGGVGLFLYEYHHETGRGVSHAVALAEAQTMAVTTVILFQIFYLLNCRSLKDSLLTIGLFSNPSVYLGIGALLLLQLVFVYAPFMNGLFGSHALNLDAWTKSMIVAAVILPVIGIEKWHRKGQPAADDA